jgi:S-adenosylmethionine:tRNA ribosyltransferase-isomerase
MIDSGHHAQRAAKLVIVDARGGIQHRWRDELGLLFSPGDLVVANDAATLPASLNGIHCLTGEPIEVRLAGWVSPGDVTRFTAIAFGAGDFRTRTEDRRLPPPLSPGDHLKFGPLTAVVEQRLHHPRLFRLRFRGDRATILHGIVRHGRPIQYAHARAPLELWDVWTRIAAEPIAFEPPSAGFALDWRILEAWRQRGIGFATLTHAAGISSTGDPALDRQLPFDEPYRIPGGTAAAIAQAHANKKRVIAVGTTVVRALEAAVDGCGRVQAGDGVASGHIGGETRLRLADAILTGVHEPGESHFELLRAFADDLLLQQIHAVLMKHSYRRHEFGDFMLIERDARRYPRS